MPRPKRRYTSVMLLDAAPLRQVLKRKFDSAGDAWRATNIERSLIEKVWNGKKPFITLDTADKACIALNIHLDEVYPFEETRKHESETSS